LASAVVAYWTAVNMRTFHRPSCGVIGRLNIGIPIPVAQQGQSRSIVLIVAALSALLLGGCAYRYAASGVAPSTTHANQFARRSRINRVARIEQTLLKPQAPPDCELKSPLSDVPLGEAARIRLDYQQQCYRQAEIITRSKLQSLQDAVNKMTERSPR
jgi:hypothetical protein